MKIFVSFSSRDREKVEPIVAALEGDGHEVFYDKASLPAGDTYDRQIEKEIHSSHCIVFCVSRNSVKAGGYCLTELKFAREKWPSAKNRVLPVKIGEVDFNEIPAYVGAVTLLDPDGNIAAETVSAARALRQTQLKAFSRRFLAPVAGLMALAVAVPGVLHILGGTSVTDQSASSLPEASLFDPTPKFQVNGAYQNAGSEVQLYGGTGIEFSPEIEAVSYQAVIDEENLEVGPGRSVPFSGTVSFGGATPVPETKWRLYFDHVSGTEYGEWIEWAPSSGSSRFELLSGSEDKPVVTGKTGKGEFLVLQSAPSELQVGSQRFSLVHEPVALASFGEEIAIASRNPAVIDFFPAEGGEKSASVSMPELKNEFDELVSTTIASFAFNEQFLWAATDGSSGSSGLLVYDRTNGQWSIAPYDSLDASDFKMKTSPKGTVLGINTFTTPTSLYLLKNAAELVEFGGHDFEDSAYANDFEWVEENLLLRNGDGEIILCGLEEERVVRVKTGPTLQRPWESAPERGEWASYKISGTFEKFFFAINKRNLDGSRRTEIIHFDGGSEESVFQNEEAETVSLTSVKDEAYAILENGRKQRCLVKINSK